MPKLVSLDRDKPLVAAAFAVADGSMTPAEGLAVLVDAERRHGLEIVREPTGSQLGCGSFWPRGPAPSDVDLARLLCDYDRFSAVYELREADVPGLDGFLAETEFVVEGMEFTHAFCLRAADGSIHSWTQRSWGREVARWANRVDWRPRLNKRGDKYAWGYMAFYCAAANFIADHRHWQGGMMAILHHRPAIGD